MKKLIVLALIFSAQIVAAQGKIYEAKEVDVKPQFPGGLNAFSNLVKKNFREAAGGSSTEHVLLEFIVLASGTISDIKVVGLKVTNTEKEALRVMASSPKWSPALVNGKAVACRSSQLLVNPYYMNHETDAVIELNTYNSPPVESVDDNNIYNVAGIEVKPEFPGGMDKFYKFFGTNFIMPDVEEGEELKGKVFATFIVEKDGSLTDIKVIREIGYGTGKEVIRVLKLSPKWNPGQQNGKKVRVQYAMPFTIDNTIVPQKK